MGGVSWSLPATTSSTDETAQNIACKERDVQNEEENASKEGEELTQHEEINLSVDVDDLDQEEDEEDRKREISPSDFEELAVLSEHDDSSCFEDVQSLKGETSEDKEGTKEGEESNKESEHEEDYDKDEEAREVNERRRRKKEEMEGFRKELDLKRSQRQRAIAGIAEEMKNLRKNSEKLEEEREERRRLEAHVSALKDVASISKQMLRIRETQVKDLKGKLESLELSCGGGDSGELRIEYGKQMEKMRSLRSLYEERATAMTVEHQRELERERAKMEVLEIKIQEQDDTLKDKDTIIEEMQAELKKLREENELKDAEIVELKETKSSLASENKALSSQMALINNLFSHMLTEPELDFDKLTRLLQENHNLINDLTVKGDINEIVALLVDIAGHSEEKRLEPSDTAVTQKEIASNLPKVWRVLIELLSHYSNPISEPCETDTGSAGCYKNIETPYGTRSVISVSQTFLRLKDLILEKNSLVKEVGRLKTLNGHLESRLENQEKRLSVVSNELHKTWGVVSKLKLQHRQLHTSEKILRYELQHRRLLLNELKEELEYCRVKWEQARQKNSQSEEDWQELRKEFASRKIRQTSNSAESGYDEDDSGQIEETSDSPSDDADEIELSIDDTEDFVTPVSEEKATSSSNAAKTATSTDSAIPEETSRLESEEGPSSLIVEGEDSLPICKVAEKLTDAMSSPSNADAMILTDSEAILEGIPERLECVEKSKCSIQKDVGSSNEIPSCAVVLSINTDAIADTSQVRENVFDEKNFVDETPANNVSSLTETVCSAKPETLRKDLEAPSQCSSGFEYQALSWETRTEENLNVNAEPEILPEIDSKIGVDGQTKNSDTKSNEEIVKKQERSSSCNTNSEDFTDCKISFEKNNRADFETAQVSKETTQSYTEDDSNSSSSSDSDKTNHTNNQKSKSCEEILDARALRLKRLEEQCTSLLSKMSKTSKRGDSISSRLEELHSQYGSQDSDSSKESKHSPSRVKNFKQRKHSESAAELDTNNQETQDSLSKALSLSLLNPQENCGDHLTEDTTTRDELLQKESLAMVGERQKDDKVSEDTSVIKDKVSGDFTAIDNSSESLRLETAPQEHNVRKSSSPECDDFRKNKRQDSHYDDFEAGAYNKVSSSETLMNVGTYLSATIRNTNDILENRALRLKMLENQCQTLFNKVSLSTHKREALVSRLEDLHEHYGSGENIAPLESPLPPESTSSDSSVSYVSEQPSSRLTEESVEKLSNVAAGNRASNEEELSTSLNRSSSERTEL